MRFALTVVVVAFLSVSSSAQEVLTQAVPARTLRLNVSGERIAYLADGGCTSQPESTLQVPAEPIPAAQCTISKMRVRANILASIDGGALER